MAGQYCGSEEKEWEMASMCGLHGFKQGLPKRSLPYALNRPAGRCHCRPSSDEFLRKNVVLFAWSAYEAPGVDPNFICHHLNVNPYVIPKKKLPQRSSRDHSNAVKDEVTKLKQARAIKEVFYPEWLANTMVVKKKNGK